MRKNRNNRKKVGFLLVLSMMLSLVLPLFVKTEAKAAGEWKNHTIYVAGILVTNENKNDVLHDGGSVKYNTVNQTLTLNNASITGAVTDMYSCAGIAVTNYPDYYYPSLTIELIGNNTIKTPNDADRSCFGIQLSVGMNLNIQGSGSLSITVGEAGNGASYGVVCGPLNIFGGTISTVTSRSTDASCGFDVFGDFTMFDGKVVTSAAALNIPGTTGIYCMGNFTVYRGTLEIKGTGTALELYEGDQYLQNYQYPKEVVLSQNYNGQYPYVWNGGAHLYEDKVKYFRIVPENPFEDVSPSAYYYNAVLWAYYANPAVTTGINPPDNTKFAPKNLCTRGQAVTMFFRMTGCPAVDVVNPQFKDVKDAGKYYYYPVYWAAENEITTGINPPAGDMFGPGNPCTRAQFVTFLWRLAGKPAHHIENPFTDVKSTSPYYDAILWAYEYGITTGTGATTFTPSKTINRAQAVTFLYRFAMNGVG